jgi:hypothetical protein
VLLVFLNRVPASSNRFDPPSLTVPNRFVLPTHATTGHQECSPHRSASQSWYPLVPPLPDFCAMTAVAVIGLCWPGGGATSEPLEIAVSPFDMSVGPAEISAAGS